MSRQEGDSKTKGQRDKGTKQKTLIHLYPFVPVSWFKNKTEGGG
jgi:hypothetical protein